jgi:HK97 family phage major capsid protein
LNSPCVVEVSKESGQAGSTVVTENIVKMHARLHRSSNPKAVWLINQDIEPQLHTLNQAVGTGGQLVYLPPGGLSDKPFGTLYGKRIVTTEWNATLGTAGDIILADLKQYLAVTRGAVKGASSMHVAFTTDEQAFRFTFRIDGQPWWNSALTPFKGTGNTQSPFITLAARA